MIFLISCFAIHGIFALLFYISQKLVEDKFMSNSLMPIYGTWLCIFGLLQNINHWLSGEINQTNYFNKGEKDMFTKKDREIIELKKKVGDYELKNELLNNEKEKYMKLLNECEDHKFIERNKLIQEDLNNLKNKICQTKYELDMKDKKIEYLEKFNSELQSLPNVKKTIDSLTSLNIAGLDEFEKIAKLFTNEKLLSTLEKFANKLN